MNPDDNKLLVVASGKCSNTKEFEPFAIRLNIQAITYDVEKPFSLEEWQARVNDDGKDRKKQHAPENLLRLVSELEKVPKSQLELRAQDAGIAQKRFRALLESLLERGDLHEQTEPRANACSDICMPMAASVKHPPRHPRHLCRKNCFRGCRTEVAQGVHRSLGVRGYDKSLVRIARPFQCFESLSEARRLLDAKTLKRSQAGPAICVAAWDLRSAFPRRVCPVG